VVDESALSVAGFVGTTLHHSICYGCTPDGLVPHTNAVHYLHPQRRGTACACSVWSLA
jgi:hypothetical protein